MGYIYDLEFRGRNWLSFTATAFAKYVLPATKSKISRITGFFLYNKLVSKVCSTVCPSVSTALFSGLDTYVPYYGCLYVA